MPNHRFARSGEFLKWSWNDTPEKVMLGCVFAWNSLTLPLVVGVFRICWFVPDEKPHLGPAKKVGPLRRLWGVRKKKAGRDESCPVR